MSPGHVVVVPSTLLLLPSYAGIEDPVPELRAAVDSAVGWLVERHPDSVTLLTAPTRPDNAARGVTDPAGERVGRHLLESAGFAGQVADDAPGLVVVANGSACRSERAPGHLDERSFGFDAAIEEGLRAGDPEQVGRLDLALGQELWAFDAPALRVLGACEGRFSASVDYADDPFGVRYWVVRWTCAS